jgi:hypothetical protein
MQNFMPNLTSIEQSNFMKFKFPMIKFSTFTRFFSGLLLLSLLGSFELANAQDKVNAWPTKTIHLLVGFPGGSTPDMVARALADGLSKSLGQTVVVDNKPGASGNIAADQVAKSTDDHTFGVVINGNLDRLRNGYYPGIFYPGLARVSKEFYSRAEQALYLSPIAVGGVRFGAWLARAAPGPWEVLVRGPNGYDVVQSTDKEPPAKNAWALAKKAFQERNGGGIF